MNGNPTRVRDSGLAAPAPEAGISLVEVSLMLMLAVMALLALYSTLKASVEGRDSIDVNYRVHGMGTEYLARLRQLSFGSPADGTPTSSQLDELFDDDTTLGNITLYQLVVPPEQPGQTFQVSREGVDGTWRVKVTSDLDGNGFIDGTRDGRVDILHIEIFFDERLIYDTFRAAEPSTTVIDTGANYLGN